MMNLKRIQTALALLLVGSASLWADGDDPFPEVNTNKYRLNMTMTAKAMLNGVELTSEDIIAVYHDDEIRSKGRPDANNKLWLTIVGDMAIEDLYFKVYTGGRIIEVDQGAQYKYDAVVGTPDEPYIINVSAPVVTTPSSEGWATTCLPYNAAVPDGVTIYTATGIADGAVQLESVTATILPKNVPVLLKSDGLTSYEWLARMADSDAIIETNLLQGTTEATPMEPGSVLTLGYAADSNKKIGFWLFMGNTVPANRAYLENIYATEARGFTLKWENKTTDINELVSHKSPSTGKSYDLSGRISTGKSRIKIINGKKMVER